MSKKSLARVEYDNQKLSDTGKTKLKKLFDLYAPDILHDVLVVKNTKSNSPIPCAKKDCPDEKSHSIGEYLEPVEKGETVHTFSGVQKGPVEQHDSSMHVNKNIHELSALNKKTAQVSSPKLVLPSWDDNFITAKSISPVIHKTGHPAKVSRSAAFRNEIIKYRTSSPSSTKQLISSSSAPMSLLSPDASQSAVLHGAAWDNGDSSVAQVENPSNSKEYKKVESADFTHIAKELWMILDAEVRASGAAILYSDVFEVAAFNSPPVALRKIIGYINLLFGLKSDWKTAKSSLFRDIRSLIIYFREVRYIIVREQCDLFSLMVMYVFVCESIGRNFIAATQAY
jgi:hypothetical protein